jgi:hypothetical protein
MRFIVTSEGPEHLACASRQWHLKDPPAEGSSVWVPELGRAIRADRVYPGNAIHSLGTRKDVEALLEAPGTPWVDHRKQVIEEQAKNIAAQQMANAA